VGRTAAVARPCHANRARHGQGVRTLSLLSARHFLAPDPESAANGLSVLGVTFLIYDYTPGLIVATRPPPEA